MLSRYSQWPLSRISPAFKKWQFITITLILIYLKSYSAYKTDPQAPNIIIILADDMGWNDVGYHGGEIPTPNIDGLAYQGVIMNRLYTAPICTPSRASLMTGRYPSNLGLQGAPPIAAGRAIALSLQEKLLPEYLKELGYSTHLVGKWHLGSYLQKHLPTNRGFDSHFGYWNGYIGHYDGIHAKKAGSEIGIDFHRNLQPAWNESYGKYITDILTDESVSIIRNHGRKSNLFLTISHAAVHTGNPGDAILPEPPRGLGPRRELIKDPKRRIYADIVKVFDESVGRIVKELAHADMLSNSVIIFMSDNGAPSVDLIYGYGNSGSNWPLRGEKVSAHEGGTRVNAVAWSPLFDFPGRVYDNLFHMVDWLPTLINAAGGRLEGGEHLDGLDHWDILRSGDPLPPTRSNLLVDLTADTEAIISGKWKLIKNFPNSSTFSSADFFVGASGRGLGTYNTSEVWTSAAAVAARRAQDEVTPQSRYEELRSEATISCFDRINGPGKVCNPSHCLYDLENDPCEQRDLSSSRPELVESLMELLQPYIVRMKPKLTAKDDPAADPNCWDHSWMTWLDPSVSSESSCVKYRPTEAFSYSHGSYTYRKINGFSHLFTQKLHWFH